MRDRHAERTFSLRGQRGERGEGPRRGVFMEEVKDEGRKENEEA